MYRKHILAALAEHPEEDVTLRDILRIRNIPHSTNTYLISAAKTMEARGELEILSTGREKTLYLDCVCKRK